MAYNESITHKALLAILHYEPETGIFTWKTRRTISNKIHEGNMAGSVYSIEKPYIRITIENVNYSAHRLAWFYVYGVWPKGQIDHINGDKSDNKIINLREASNSQNNQNKKVRKDSSTGIKGVSFDKRKNKYRAAIKVDGAQISLGSFKTPEEAHAAYCRAAEQHFGEFANFGQLQPAQEILLRRQALARR